MNGVWRPGSLLILDDEVHDWAVANLANVTPDSLSAIFQADPQAVEFLLLGTGATQALPPKTLRETLRDRRLGLEFMATEAAVKLYNVLASDGRRLACALIAV